MNADHRVMGSSAPPLRVLAFSSINRPCGIADYHFRLVPHIPAAVDTVGLISTRILRDRPLELLRQRWRYRALAARADTYDVALLQLIQTWNGFRLGEHLLPTFLARMNRPLVVVMHEWPDPVSDDKSGSAMRDGIEGVIRQFDFGGLTFEQWLHSVFFPRVTRFIVHAEHLQQRLIDAGVPRDRITFALLPPYEPPPSPPTATLPFNVSPGMRIVLMFGFPHPRKGYDVAVRALAQLPKNFLLVMVGSIEGEFRQKYVAELNELARSNGVAERFIVTGEISDSAVSMLFKRVDVVLSPALYATGSASTSYAIATGVPVIASDIPSITALRHAGAGIVTFDTDNADACAVALRDVLENDHLRDELRRRNENFARACSFNQLGAIVGEQLRLAAAGTGAAHPDAFSPARAHQ